MEIVKQALLFAGVLWAGWLLQNEPMIPVVWAAALTLVFGILMMAMALVSPAISNRSLVQAQRTVNDSNRARIEELAGEVQQLEQALELTRAEKRQLQSLNDRLAFDLEMANERLIELQNNGADR